MGKRRFIIIGFLFIVCTASGVGSVSILGNPHQTRDVITLCQNEMAFITGILLVLLMAFSAIGISVCIYPLIKEQCPTLALAAVTFRTVEGVFGALGSCCYLALLFLYRADGLTESIGNFILTFKYLLTTYGMAMAFALGAIMYYTAFLKTKIVLRWLAIWGVVGATLHLFAVILVTFGYAPFSPPLLILNLPIALQEMVFAIWLILYGLNKNENLETKTI